MSDVGAARALFSRRFGVEPEVVVRSPGRVNLIGEHVDYNDGLVLPLAIDRGTLVAARASDDARVRAVSADVQGELDAPLDALLAPVSGEPSFGPYVRGVLAMLPKPKDARAFDLSITSDLPIGAGLSSSASLEVGVAVAAQALGFSACAPKEIARLCQRAENEVAGVRSGIMDQLAVACGKEDAALLIDCRSLDVTLASVPAHARVLILDSAAPRTLAGSAYNDRRAACEEAARLLGMSLRDASDSKVALDALPAALLPRARHVVSEIVRTREMVDALARGDLERAGALMRASHQSLRVDYEVSSVPLDVLVEEACATAGVFGARLTGAGFGGCVVALVDAQAAAQQDVGAAIVSRYRARTGLPGRSFLVRASDGAHVVWRAPS